MSNDWYIKINNAEHGPLTSERLKQLAQQGKVTPEAFVKKGASGTWLQANHVTGLFPMAASAGTPATAAPLPKPGSPPTIPTATARSAVTAQRRIVPTALPPTQALPPVAEEEGHLVRNVGITAGIITVLLIALLIVPDMMHDKWELNNSDRVIATLKQADGLQKSDPFAAYKVYDEVLKEAKQHKTTALLSDELASAEKARAALHAKVEDKIRAEDAEKKRLAEKDEAEKKRLAEDEAKRAEAQQLRIAQEKARKVQAEKVAESRRRELAEKAAFYKRALPQARAALNALKKIEARTEVGISCAKFTEVLGEQYAEIKIFLESPEGREMHLFSLRVSQAIDEYKKASNDIIWQVGGPQAFWKAASTDIKDAEVDLRDCEKIYGDSP